MTSDEAESWDGMFALARPDRRAGVQERARKERRTQLTEKQRRRTAVRTEQLNFRCAIQFKDQVSALAKQHQCSIPDLMEMAIAALMEKTHANC